MKGQGNRNGTAVVRAPQQTKNKKQQQQQNKKQVKPTPVKSSSIPNKGGVRIGECKDEDKWRCRTCKFLNDIENDECTTCGDPHPGAKKV